MVTYLRQLLCDLVATAAQTHTNNMCYNTREVCFSIIKHISKNVTIYFLPFNYEPISTKIGRIVLE